MGLCKNMDIFNNDGSVTALEKCTCTFCLPDKYCRELKASSLTATPNTQINAIAVDIDSVAYAQRSR